MVTNRGDLVPCGSPYITIVRCILETESKALWGLSSLLARKPAVVAP
jgi:hypothetical protein